MVLDSGSTRSGKGGEQEREAGPPGAETQHFTNIPALVLPKTVLTRDLALIYIYIYCKTLIVVLSFIVWSKKAA